MKPFALLRAPLGRALCHWRLLSCTALSSMVLLAAPQAGAVMMDLGTVPNDLEDSAIPAGAISGNGKVVVGTFYSFNYDASNHVIRWTAADGAFDLNQALNIYHLGARATNADGSVIAGYGPLDHAKGNYDDKALRWSATDGLTDLGTLGGQNSYAFGISDDGAVIVGESETAASSKKAFRWTSTGMQNLGSLNANEASAAHGVSGNGAVVVGNSGNRAFRWEASAGMQDLGTLGGSSKAVATDRTGAVVVGESALAGTTTDLRAFRWTAASGMQDLGTLGGAASSATDVNADGSIIVGWAQQTDGSDNAFRWNLADGMTSLGVLSDEIASAATAVSDDGNTIIGTSGSRSFIWTSDTPTAPAIQDLGNLQLSQITSADTLARLTASQNRRLRDLNQQLCLPSDSGVYCLSGGAQAYTGEGAGSGRQRNLQLTGGLRVNEHYSLGAATSIGRADLATEGAKQDHAYGLALWAFYQQQPTLVGWTGSASVALGRSENRLERGKGLLDVQRAEGRTALNSTSARLAVGYGYNLGTSQVTPEVALSMVSTDSQGFTERNNALPLTLKSSRSRDTYATFGVRSATPLSAKTLLNLGLAVDVLLQDDTDAIEGSSKVPGLSQFTLRNTLDKRHFVPVASAGLSYAVSPNASVSGQVQAGASTYERQKNVYGLGVEYRYRF